MPCDTVAFAPLSQLTPVLCEGSIARKWQREEKFELSYG